MTTLEIDKEKEAHSFIGFLNNIPKSKKIKEHSNSFSLKSIETKDILDELTVFNAAVLSDN